MRAGYSLVSEIMYVIYIETERTPLKYDSFDLIHSIERIENICYPLEEIIQVYESDDRLRAAIVNFGTACRWYYDRHIRKGFIEIKTDRDGKDHRFDNEHGVLFSLLHPANDFEARKYLSLYHEYNKFLGRAKQLILQCEITVHLGE